MTKKAQDFMKANDESGVISGTAHGQGGGGTYTLADGRVFRMSLEDMRACPVGVYPKWDFSGCRTDD